MKMECWASGKTDMIKKKGVWMRYTCVEEAWSECGVGRRSTAVCGVDEREKGVEKDAGM